MLDVQFARILPARASCCKPCGNDISMTLSSATACRPAEDYSFSNTVNELLFDGTSAAERQDQHSSFADVERGLPEALQVHPVEVHHLRCQQGTAPLCLLETSLALLQAQGPRCDKLQPPRIHFGCPESRCFTPELLYHLSQGLQHGLSFSAQLSVRKRGKAYNAVCKSASCVFKKYQ